MLKVRLILIFCCLGVHFLWAQKTDFAVEVAAFAERVPLTYFNKLKNVYETVDANYIFRYSIDVKDRNQAEQLKQEVRAAGFVHARVIDFGYLRQFCSSQCGWTPPSVLNEPSNNDNNSNVNNISGMNISVNSKMAFPPKRKKGAIYDDSTTAKTIGTETIIDKTSKTKPVKTKVPDEEITNPTDTKTTSIVDKTPDTEPTNPTNFKTTVDKTVKTKTTTIPKTATTDNNRDSENDTEPNEFWEWDALLRKIGDKTYDFLQKEDSTMQIEWVFFDFGRYGLRYKSRVELRKVAYILRKYPNFKAQLHAHTDSRGSASANQRLSLKRATAAQNYLLRKGVKTQQVEIQGFGHEKPVAKNELSAGEDTPQGRQFNRRVEINMLDKNAQPVEIVDIIEIPENLKIK